MLRARLFGPMTLDIDGGAVPEIAGLRPRSLLAWLLMEPGHHARAHVAARFWPDVLDTSARASLRNALSTIRAALDAADGVRYLEADRVSVGIAAGLPREVDVERFARLTDAGDPVSLARAFALADAPLLSDLADDWVLEARDEWRDRLVGVALRLADHAEARGDAAEAIAWTRRALRHARLREAVHRTLMERLAAAGDRAEALEAYARLTAILAAEFGTPPSEATRALAARLRADERSGGATAARPTGPATEIAPACPPPIAGRPPLIGRARELGVLTASWERTCAGAGGVALVTGAPGIGKSRLVAELGERAVASGGRRAVGAVLDLDGAPPLGPWSDALHQLVQDGPRPPPDAAWPDDLVHVCRTAETVWGRRASRLGAAPEIERMRLFETLIAALAWWAADRPLLVVLEDLQRMDAASVALLAAVSRRAPAWPMLLVVTGRDGDERVAVTADALRRADALGAQVALAPLPDRDIAAIVAAVAPSLDPSACRRVVEAAGGMPLLAREAAHATAAGADPAEGLAEWVRGPLARLSDPARRLVDLVAAAGRPLERGEAAELVGARALTAALEEACAVRLLDDREDRRIAFHHALVRDACYAALPAAHRAGRHGELADAMLARSSRSVAEIARHLLLAHRDEDATSHLAAAAAAARRLGALDEAAAFLREAIAVADGDQLAAELWLLLAEVESWRGARDAYEDAFRHATELLEHAGDVAALAAAHTAHARCLRTTLCYPRASLAAYERALELVEPLADALPELRAMALAGAAWAEAVSGDVHRAHALIAQAEALPEAARDPALAAELALDRSAALMRTGRFAESEAMSERAVELALAAGRPELSHVARINAASAAAVRGDPARALELVESAAGMASGAAHPDAQMAETRAYALARLGRHEEARRAARELVHLAQRSARPAAQAMAAFDEGSIALAGGDARAAATRLRDALDDPDGRVPRALARLRLADALLAAGDINAAAAELERVPFEPVGPADMPDALVPRLRRLQGLIAGARGDAETGLAHLASAEAGWRSLPGASASGDRLAAAFVDLGRPPVAGLLEPVVELGRVLSERALLLSRLGRADQARRAAERAARLADELAYDGYRDTLARAVEAIDLEVRR
jgi:DNA-binding SARP family transcriptional activator/tetratricopeptide (TPR) repeat protein